MLIIVNIVMLFSIASIVPRHDYGR